MDISRRISEFMGWKFFMEYGCKINWDMAIKIYSRIHSMNGVHLRTDHIQDALESYDLKGVVSSIEEWISWYNDSHSEYIATKEITIKKRLPIFDTYEDLKESGLDYSTVYACNKENHPVGLEVKYFRNSMDNKFHPELFSHILQDYCEFDDLVGFITGDEFVKIFKKEES